MRNVLISHTRGRRGRLLVFAVLAFGVAALACTTDRETPLGNDLTDDILGSDPGTVFRDSMGVIAPATLTYHTPIAGGDLDLGREGGFRRTMILRPRIGEARADSNRVVQSANLVLRRASLQDAGDMLAVFYELGTMYTEGDTVAVLDTTQVIPDPQTGSGTRILSLTETDYPLPPALVQAWIRDESLNKGIAIVYVGANDQSHRYNSRSAAKSFPQLAVTYTSGTPRNINISDDATRIESLNPPPGELTIGDGVVRRVHVSIDTSTLPDSAAVHRAILRLHMVPGSLVGTNTSAVLFAPDSMSTSLSGPNVTSIVIPENGVVDIPVTLTLLAFLSGDLPNNGFTLRFADENTEIRQAAFYGNSAADSLRPRLTFTASTPGTFAR